MARLLAIGALLPLLLALAHARTWTNLDGNTIEAEYVSSDGTIVRLKKDGREVEYPLAKLSEEDRAFVHRLLHPPPPPTGRRENLPIAAALFPETGDYFKDKLRQAALEAFEAGVFEQPGDRESWLKRDFAADTCTLYVPASYDGTKPFGIYLHISASPEGKLMPAWEAVFDELQVIAVTAHGVGNQTPMLRRVRLSVDALATVEKEYRIDPARRAVGGISGGGHMAMLTAALFPELFAGAVSHAAQSYLPEERGGGHFPGFTLGDFTSGRRKELRWIVVSGDKDRNYPEILKSSEEWKRAAMDYRFLDVPGMGHTGAAPEHLREALKWIGL